MSNELLDYLKSLDETLKNSELHAMIKQRADLYDQATYLQTLLTENRTSAVYIRKDDPMWDRNNLEFMSITRQQSFINRAAMDLDIAIMKWIDHAPAEIQPLLRTIKTDIGYNG